MKKRYFTRMAVCLSLLVCCATTATALDKSYYADASVLASGKWVKISVTESGIYQITADDIREWGLGNDLSQIHVFGYGGAPLSEKMSGDNYADDLPQTPMARTADRLLFYAQGPLTWQRNNDFNVEYVEVQHPYAIMGSYLVTNDSRFSDKEIEKAQNIPAGNLVTTFTARQYHEKDIINPGESGRDFLGEDFKSNNKQTFKFNLEGLVNDSPVTTFTMFAANIPSVNGIINHSYNGQNLTESKRDSLYAAGGSDIFYKFNGCVRIWEKPGSVKSFTLDGTTELNYTLDFSCDGTVNLARLDKIAVNYERNLALVRGYLDFGLFDASTSKSYRLTECGSATHVWDVTRPFAIVEMNATISDGTATFSPTESGRREFVAFDESGEFPHPETYSEVSNQNIHAEPVPDMIIITPSAYMEQAKRVAELHEKVDRFRVLVVDHEKVYNEFSSGTQDAMAYRRLCKMFWDRGMSEDGHRLGYLLLMGCGSYDNRLIGTEAEELNYPRLLTWQSLRGYNDESITSDDYFGVLADDKAISYEDKIDISVGRMIVKSVGDARTVVNKLVKYVCTPDYGSWKNQALMVADDGNKAQHMEQSDLMISTAQSKGGDDIVFNRVYIDAFESVSNGGSRNYPEARNKMFNALKEGVLWWNYIGHASTQNWTGDGLMMRSDVETQLFYRHLPVLFAATCEYTRFDNAVLSGGERIFLNANGGAVAVLCPARVALISSNGVLSANVGKYVFSADEQGKPRRIGDILRLAKNSINASVDNNNRFFCFGDPAMRLAWAPYHVKVETINGQPVNSETPPKFKAREQVEFSGKIVNFNGEQATNFNGAVISTLYGPEQSVTTHGNHAADEISVKFTYTDRPNRLAINVDTVIGGEFTVRVIIPSEVNNEYEDYSPSLINLYAYDSRDSIEAKGANSDFIIYGYQDEEVTDTIGPRIITLGLNDDNFVDGCEVNESPLVLATIADDSGVNFSTAGVGHNITLTLDGTTTFNDVASFYMPMFAEQGTLGNISYQLSDLSPGQHTLRLRVWDVYNNMSEKTITFNVVKGLAPEIADVYCAANPASVETSFYVKHNRPEAVVSVTIEVYDLMGRMVWNTTQSGRSDMYVSAPITWDLIDFGGRRVPRGIYVYRATISTDGIKEATKAKKLAVTGE